MNDFKMDYYEKISKAYPELHKEEQVRKIKRILEEIKIAEDAYVLDVGAGPCWLNEFLPNVFSLDPVEEFLRMGKTTKAVVAYAEYIPFQNKTFDLVFCLTSLHNFFDMEKAIKEMIRVGKEAFIITLLKKSPRYDMMKELIEKNLKIERTLEDETDTILICSNIIT